ncbi:MAG: E2F family transcription factor [archaeon]|nr:E2F family transcription factor [archaeon]
MNGSNTINKKQQKRIYGNILVVSEEYEEMEKYLEKFITYLECPKNIILNQPSLKIYQVLDHYLINLSLNINYKTSLQTMFRNLNVNQKMIVCSFISENSEFKNLFDLNEIKKNAEITKTFNLSFEKEDSTPCKENYLPHAEISVLPKDNPKVFLDLLNSRKRKENSHVTQKNGTHIIFNLYSPATPPPKTYLLRKRKEIFSVTKVHKFTSPYTESKAPSPNIEENSNLKTLEMTERKFSAEEEKTLIPPIKNPDFLASPKKKEEEVEEEDKKEKANPLNIKLGNLISDNEEEVEVLIEDDKEKEDNKEKEDDKEENEEKEDKEDDKEEKEEKEDSDLSTARNSLIAISKEVYRYIEAEKQTQGSAVTNHILKILKEKGNKLNYKNIQRRVYDAINVMCAIGIIKKSKGFISIVPDAPKLNFLTKKDGHFSGRSPYNTRFGNKCQYKSDDEVTIEHFENDIKKHKEDLVKNSAKIFFYNKFLKMNKNDFNRCNTEDKLTFPFYLVLMEKDGHVSVKEVENSNKAIVLAESPFSILEPEKIMQYFIQKDFKNENLNTLLSEDTSEYLKKNNLLKKYFSTMPKSLLDRTPDSTPIKEQSMPEVKNCLQSSFIESPLIRKTEEFFNQNNFILNNYNDQINMSFGSNLRALRNKNDSIPPSPYKMNLFGLKDSNDCSFRRPLSNCSSKGVSPFVKKFK